MKATVLMLMLALTVTLSAQTKPTVSMKYIAGAEALAADDYAKAKAAFTDLAKESQGEVKAKAQATADAADLKAMRKSFRALSEVVAKMEPPKGYALAFCPMYENGSQWVQKQGPVANPYYGKSMLTCGELKK